MTFAAAMLLLAVFSEEPWEYPFGRFESAAETRRADRLERRYAGAGGTALAVRQTCAGNDMSLDVPELVARNFLVAHADRTFPRLLDRLARSASDGSSCPPRLARLILTGVCFGYDVGGSGPALDAHPLAVERRARARSTLVRALEGGGRRSDPAFEILDDMGHEICSGLADAMRAATPALVKRLGVPTPPNVVPADREDEPKWARALRTLTAEGVDRAVAEAPVRAFLAHDETVALAARALAHMGADATGAVPRLQRLLDAVVPPQGTSRNGDLTRVGDVLRALQAIGKPAAVALPNVAAFADRVEMPGCRTFGRDFFVDLVRALVTPATATTAIDILGPMLRCPGYNINVAEALAELGPAARDAVLSSLRDESRTIAERLAAAHALARPDEAPLGAADAHLVELLEAKRRTHKQHVTLNLSPKSFEDAPGEVPACRAEAGLEGLPAPKSTASWDFVSCISNYLCGPAQETYFQTMARCCVKEWNKSADYCRDLSDRPPFRD